MADGRCGESEGAEIIEKKVIGGTIRCEKSGAMSCDVFYPASVSDKLFDGLCSTDVRRKEEPQESDDCRKKRCVDRYDSSESSDSGVAVLSCTDCSGSSTASSDITDPGSPFSTTSNHSDDATPIKMAPAAHWPAWDDDATAIKRAMERAADKRRKSADTKPNKMQQGKITEYFKTHVKPNLKPPLLKAVDQQTQFNSLKTRKEAKPPPAKKRIKTATTAPPRKILPAPSKPANVANFTLTAVSFPPNLAYLHTKVAKPPDLFVPQFITDNILNVLQPVPKMAAVGAFPTPTFNCVNATVVPIVKVNQMPSRIQGFAPPPPSVPLLGVEAATPTTVVAFRTDLVPPEPTIEVCDTGTEPMDKCEEDSGIASESSDKSPPPPPSPLGCLEVKIGEEAGVAATPAEPPQKSPILSKPKTIRFPFNKDGKDRKATSAGEAGRCRWKDCSAEFDTNAALLEHLQLKHVISQANKDQYVCFWLGCKVHGRTSCSRTWLERHVLAHAGTKLFRCIVDGCGQRFNSQLSLQRHVNGHFNTDSSSNGSAKKTTESLGTKLFKRNGKKIRFRRQPWSARMFDFIDGGIMEGLQHKLMALTESRTLGDVGVAGDDVNLRSQVMARRTESDGTVKVLVRWHPVDIVPDEWIAESDYKTSRTVSIPSLGVAAKAALKPRLHVGITRNRKHRRKYVREET